ncbi:MAG: glycosyl hydrolase family 28-related protein, partial [Verrucomicrobiales bacterium]
MPRKSSFHPGFALYFGALLACLPRLGAEPSKIYGEDGESWNTAGGPLPDFSYAGYHRGEQPIPDLAPDLSVKDHGAKGDGVTDDTAAIQEAIVENPGKTILLPAGRYLLSDFLHIKKSRTVLQGEGPDKTIIIVSAPLQEIHPNPITYPDTGGTAYAYSGGFIRTSGPAYYEATAYAITEPAVRGDTAITLASGHPFEVGDEIVILIRDDPEQTLLTYLYRGDPADISNAGSSRAFRHVTRITKVDGGAVTIERPLSTDLRSTWKPEVHAFKPALEEVGIEHLAFEFPDNPYLGH